MPDLLPTPTAYSPLSVPAGTASAGGTWGRLDAARRASPASQLPAHNNPHIPLQDSYTVLMQITLPEGLGLRFRLPFLALTVSDADRDGVYVVTDTFSTVYGEGGDPRMAIGDYLDTLLSRFLDLERHEAILAPGLRKDLSTLRRYISRTT